MATNEKLWYVLKAIGGKEVKTKENVEAEIKRRGLEDLVGEVLVPVEKVYQQRNGKKVVKEHVLFSGYVFVECILNKEVQAVLSNVQNVLGFLTVEKIIKRADSKGKLVKDHIENVPQSMRVEEVNRMIGRVDQVTEDTYEEASPFVVGDKVKVTDGSFASFTGEVEEVNEEKKKLIVTIALFGRKTPLEVGYSQVVKEA